eukprot:gene13472-14864_t
MFGQDFVSDLLGLLDITAPLCEFMVLSQSVNFLHWKNILWGNRMLFYMEAIINNLEEVPRYKKQLENIKNCNFQEVQLFLLNQDKMVHPDHDEEAQYTWMERTFNQSLEELKVFAVDLKVSAKNRLENGTAEISRPLAKCFDFEEMLVALAGRSCSEKAMQCVADKAHYLAMGREQFQIWFKYVISLPHVQEKKDNFEFLDESCSDVVFHHFKKCLCEMVWGDLKKRYKGEPFLATTTATTFKEKEQIIDHVDGPKLLEDQLTVATIIDVKHVSKFSRFVSCQSCHKKVTEINLQSKTIKCTHCDVCQKLGNCKRDASLQLTVITSDEEELTLKFFTEEVNMMLSRMNVDLTDATDKIKSAFLT